MKSLLISALAFFCLALNCSGSKNVTPEPDPDEPETETVSGTATSYLTRADANVRFKKESITSTVPATLSAEKVTLNMDKTYQTVDGFGAAITGATCYNLLKMSQSDRSAFLKEIFDRKDGLGSSLIRVSIGASDFPVKTEFTWCDTPGLENFGPAEEDEEYLFPVLKEIYDINPDVKIIATPWSAPLWMKTKETWTASSLKPEYYENYAQYFVKWIQYMESLGFNIYAVTPQNEPLNKGNSMSMYMTWKEQRDFIKTALGPAFEKAGIKTKILVFDHNYNYDNVSSQKKYPLNIYADAEASKYIAGSAWHNYGGSVSELSSIIASAPDKEIYFTEASIGTWNYNFSDCLINDFDSIFMGTLMRMGKGVTLWNLLLDDKKGPHSSASGACSTCYGAVNINSSDYKTLDRYSHYYNIAHASKVIKPGAVRIEASGYTATDFQYLAFLNTDNTIGIIMLNKGSETRTPVFTTDKYSIRMSVPARSIASLTWTLPE